MRVRSALTVLLAACLSTAACGAEREDRAVTVNPTIAATGQAAAEPTGQAAPEVDGDVTLTQEQLTVALLTVQELPTGYSAAASSDDDDDTATTGADDECSTKFAQLSAAEGTEAAGAEAAFEGGFGIVLEQSLESYEDSGELEQRFADVADVLSECPTFTDTDADGTVTDLQVSALSFPNLGDRTLALALTGVTEDLTVRLNIVIVQLGNHAMYLAQGGLAADAAVLEQAGRVGAAKLAAAIDAA